jgi:spore coat protein U-like protein
MPKTLSGATVTYTLYSNAGRTTVSDDIGTGGAVSGTGSGSTQSLTAYGRIPLQTTPAPGTYSDTIVVTVSY